MTIHSELNAQNPERTAQTPQPKIHYPKHTTFSFSLSRGLLLVLLLLLAIVLIFSIKPLLALYHQGQAGRALGEVVAVGDNEYGGFACLRPFVEDLQQRESLQTALTHLRKAESFAPNQSHTYLLLGRTFCLLGDYESAIPAFQKFGELRPKNPLGYLEMGFALLQACLPNGKCPDGLNTYDAWRKAGVRAEDFLALAERARQKEDYATALLWYQNAQRMGMELRSTVLYMRFILLRNTDKERSKELLEQAVTFDSGWIDASMRFVAWHWYARQLYEHKKISKAERTFYQAISYNSGDITNNWALSECYRFLGLINFYHNKKLNEAEKFFQKALDIYPKNTWAYIGLGILLYQMDNDNLADSDQYFQEAIKLDKKNLILWITLVKFWISIDRVDRAQEYCRQVVENGFSTDDVELCRDIYP